MSAEYGADQIQILEGLEGRPQKTWYVHWKYLRPRDFTIWCMRL